MGRRCVIATVDRMLKMERGEPIDESTDCPSNDEGQSGMRRELNTSTFSIPEGHSGMNHNAHLEPQWEFRNDEWPNYNDLLPDLRTPARQLHSSNTNLTSYGTNPYAAMASGTTHDQAFFLESQPNWNASNVFPDNTSPGYQNMNYPADLTNMEFVPSDPPQPLAWNEQYTSSDQYFSIDNYQLLRSLSDPLPSDASQNSWTSRPVPPWASSDGRHF